jgi:tight adherence protein B
MQTNLIAASSADALLLAMVVLGPLIALYGVLQLAGDLRRTNRRKIASRLKGRSGVANAANAAMAVESLRRQQPNADSALGRMLGQMRATERLQKVLEQANLPWSAPKVMVNLTLVAAILLAASLVIGLSIFAGVGVAIAVYVLPVLYLFHRRRQRLKRLAQQLPDVFELLSQALRAGHSLASAMQLVANEMADPAGTEFGRVFHEQNLGIKVEDALVGLAERMDVLDVRFFVTAVLIQRQTGGDLAEVLDNIGSVIRDRIKLHGTVQALTAEGRLSGYVLLALPVVVFMVMLRLNYEYAALLWQHPMGQMMSMFAVVQMIMGWLMIKKIINIKV